MHLRMREHGCSIRTHCVAFLDNASIQLRVLQTFLRIHAIAQSNESFPILPNRRIRVQLHLLSTIPLLRSPRNSMALRALHRQKPRIQEIFVFFARRRHFFASPPHQTITLFLRSRLHLRFLLLFLPSAVRTKPCLSFGHRRQVQAA